LTTPPERRIIFNPIRIFLAFVKSFLEDSAMSTTFTRKQSPASHPRALFSALRRGALLGLALGLMALPATQVWAQEYWTGATSTDWTTATNWYPALPGDAGEVYIVYSGANNPVLATTAPASGSFNFVRLGDDSTPSVLGGSGAPGTLTVGAGGELITEILTVGYHDVGTLTLQAGGTATASDFVSIASSTDADGSSLTVTGAGSELTAQTLSIGSGGEGTLTLADGGKAGATNAVQVGVTTSASGALNIGSGAAPGILDAPSVSGGTGGGTVTFNHNATAASKHYFTDDGSDSGNPVDLLANLEVVNTAGYTVLPGANTYALGTTITAGTLEVTGTLGSCVADTTLVCSYAGNIDNGGALIFNQNDDQVLSGSISGAGDLEKGGSGILTLSGTNTGYTGDITVTAGTLEITGALGPSSDYSGNIYSNNTLTFNQATAQTLSGTISGMGLTKAGTGDLTLTGDASGYTSILYGKYPPAEPGALML